MIVPQPAVLPDDLGDGERPERVGVADDVDGAQPHAVQRGVEQSGVAEQLLEEGDDDHPGDEVRQIRHRLHEAADAAAGEAVQQQGEGERHGEVEGELEDGDPEGVEDGRPERPVLEHPLEVARADPGTAPDAVERHVLLERDEVAYQGAVVEQQEVGQAGEHEQDE